MKKKVTVEALARFWTTLGSLLGGGVPLVEALESAASERGPLRAAARAVAKAVRGQKRFTDGLRAAGAFDAATVRLMDAAEARGELDHAATRLGAALAEGRNPGELVPPVAGVLPSPEALTRFGRMVGHAVKQGATAIHVGPVFDEETQRSVPRLALRVGGALAERERLSDDDYRDLLSRAKQMADLDLAEQRLPQEGRMMLSIGGEEVDLLVNLSPTALGERLCLRVLAPGERRPELAGVLPREALDTARRWLARPWGLVVLCGAPGVAHRGLYYAFLTEARTRGHVASVEDAVESTLSGVTQIQADRRVGLTPARAIRAAMRQDPNVLGIGDLREAEEAELAVEAALTGHVVVAQVSATDAAAALARLASWAFDAEAPARALAGVLARRLDGAGRVVFDAIDSSDAIRAGVREGRSVPGFREIVGAARG